MQLCVRVSPEAVVGFQTAAPNLEFVEVGKNPVDGTVDLMVQNKGDKDILQELRIVVSDERIAHIWAI